MSNRYDEIYESLNESLENGEISLEAAEIINEAAYEKYVEEADCEDCEDNEEYDESVYDVIYPEIVDAYESGAISKSVANLLNESAAEKYSDVPID